LFDIEEHSIIIVNSLQHTELSNNDFLEIITKKDVEKYFVIKSIKDNNTVLKFNSLKDCKNYIELS
jgi:hypothetical protein